MGDVEIWQRRLATGVAAQNPAMSASDADAVAARAMGWLVVLRFCAGPGALPRTRQTLGEHLRSLDSNLHATLFAAYGAPTSWLVVDDSLLDQLIGWLDAPGGPCQSPALGIDMLGRLYERSFGRRAPHARKSSGVYYTPDHIVRYMVESTIGALLEGSTPDDAANLRILDPACGSGSFMLGALRHLTDWRLSWYLEHDPARHAQTSVPPLYRDGGGHWRLTAAKRGEILRASIFGVDIDPRAIEVAKLSLWLDTFEGSLDEAGALAHLGANVRCGNSLVDAEFDYGETFPAVFERGGFDVVIGNPPYVSYGGRQAVDLPDAERRYFARHYQAAGWAAAHSLFMERAARHLSRRIVSFIVPDQVGHLAGYRSLRELMTSEGRITQVRYWGEHVFKEAVTPSVTFILDKWGRPGDPDLDRVVNVDGSEHRLRIEGGDAWTVSSSNRLLEKLAKDSISIRPWLADCGIRTTHAKSQVVKLAEARGRFLPVLEGKQVGRYACDPPQVAVLLDAGAPLFVGRDEKYAKTTFLVRQTAAYPIVGPRRHATYFRNSLHALYPPDNGMDARYVVGLLNSKLLRFAYVSTVREAKQRVFPQVKLGPLGALPIRALRLHLPEEKERHDRIVGLVDEILALKRDHRTENAIDAPGAVSATAQQLDRRIDDEVFRLYDLTEDEIASVEATVATLARPP